MFWNRCNRIARFFASAGFVGGLLLVFVLRTAPSALAARYGTFDKVLGADDRLVVKADNCSLKIKTQSDAKIVVRCAPNTQPVELPNSPQARASVKLGTRQKVRVTGDLCALSVTSSSVSRIVIKCKAAGWLAYVNSYRDMADLPSVSENTAWSHGNELHGRYMVKNDIIAHTEDTSNPWYTPEGLAAAQASNLIVSDSPEMSFKTAIDGWMQAPFHAVGIVDPALGQVGYGEYHEADGGIQSGAGLDVIRGLGSVPIGVTYPVVWPSQGKTVSLLSHWGESPSPLTSCPGYAAPSGLPILLQLGHWSVTPYVTAHSFMRGGTWLEHCVFDETNYVNPDSALQSLGRSILNSRDAIVLIPRAPLTAGQTYTVSITTNGQTYAWSFSVSSGAGVSKKESGTQIR